MSYYNQPKPPTTVELAQQWAQSKEDVAVADDVAGNAQRRLETARERCGRLAQELQHTVDDNSPERFIRIGGDLVVHVRVGQSISLVKLES